MLDAFLTRLANQESQRRLTLGTRYCPDARDVVHAVFCGLPNRNLIAFASDRAATPAPSGPRHAPADRDKLI